MIRTPTVFVLGAGPSVDYGLPLGSTLVELIVDGLGSTGFLRKPLLDAGFPLDNLERFADRLKHSELLSIDAFLEGNEVQFTEIGRAAIASSILFRERDARDHLFAAQRDDHWLRYLWNAMKSQTNADNFGHNKVSFVTFNYDRLVEYYFETVFQTVFNLGRDDAQALRDRATPIIHLHGSIINREFGEYSHPPLADVVKRIAGGIRVVHDPIARGDPIFESAREVMKHAQCICFLGFGYPPVNLTRLQLQSLNENPNPKHLLGTVYGLGLAEIDMAKTRIGREFTTGSQKQGIEDFLREHLLMQ